MKPTQEEKALRALVVDDEDVARLVQSKALEGAGFQVDQAHSGDEALDSVCRQTPGLILLDVEMPGMDGFETCRQIRAIPECQDTLILMVTARTDQETIDRAFEVGATDFLSKPIDLQLFGHRIRFLQRATHAFVRLRSTMDQLEANRARLLQAQKIARLGHWEWDVGGEAMEWSAELISILGVEEDPRPSWQELIQRAHVEDRAELAKMRDALENGEKMRVELEHRVETPGGTRIVSHHAESTPLGESGERRVLGTLQDITERRERDEQIQRLALYDSVTGLPNRRSLYEWLERTMAEPDVEGLALLSIDIDRFRRINESLGSAAGDRVLQTVAAATCAVFDQASCIGAHRPFVARVASDEFVAVVPGAHAADFLGHQASLVTEALREPIELESGRVALSVSVGVAVYPDDGESPDELLMRAGAAREEAARHGGGEVCFSNASLSSEAQNRLTFEAELRGAIEAGELDLYYQPKIASRDGQIQGVEALVRWKSPKLGFVSPADFIPIAEETGLIHQISEWVLERGCADLRRWRNLGLRTVPVAMNVSSKQLHRSDVATMFEACIARHELAPTDLEVEITESALLVHGDDVGQTLASIRELGVPLALDDFGTGYSSLTHLCEFPIDVVKIDRSFISDLEERPQQLAIVRSIVVMGQELGMKIVAEGVETEAEAGLLRDMGCDLLQGYLFAKPMPADELEAQFLQP